MIRDASKILIIRLSSLGDVILTTPVVRSLKESFPSAGIDFLTRENFGDVFKHNPRIGQLIFYTKPADVLSKLKANNYNLVIDLQNNLRSRQLTKKLHVKTLRFRKPSLKKLLLVRFKINRFKTILSIPEMYAETVPGLKLDDTGAEIFTSEASEIGKKNNNPTVALCPGSKHFTKRWPSEYFAELGKLLMAKKIAVKIVGGNEDTEICAKISSEIPGAENVNRGNNLFHIVNEIRNSTVVVCNDSGLMHAAGAAGTPLVALFGSTVREFGFSPYKCKSTILENNSLSCRPCSHIGRDNCPQKHFDCMKGIEPKNVLDEVLKVIEQL